MKFKEFETQLLLPIFTAVQAGATSIQLSRWVKSGNLNRLKRGLYQFAGRSVDEFSLAGLLYPPSYISLEAALNNQGIIPDVNAAVTSVSPTTTKMVKISQGSFFYAKIQPSLFFGWQTVKDANGLPYKIALPEKALLDWIYLRKIRDLSGHRVDIGNLNKTRLIKFTRQFPAWVRKVINEQLNR